MAVTFSWSRYVFVYYIAVLFVCFVWFIVCLVRKANYNWWDSYKLHCCIIFSKDLSLKIENEHCCIHHSKLVLHHYQDGVFYFSMLTVPLLRHVLSQLHTLSQNSNLGDIEARFVCRNCHFNLMLHGYCGTPSCTVTGTFSMKLCVLVRHPSRLPSSTFWINQF